MIRSLTRAEEDELRKIIKAAQDEQGRALSRGAADPMKSEKVRLAREILANPRGQTSAMLVASLDAPKRSRELPEELDRLMAKGASIAQRIRPKKRA
jgi:hypothetical protein